MSKKAAVKGAKKSRRRLKRSVRRSLAAVLMITAIGIAAIPVPENFADDGTNQGDDNNNNNDPVITVEAPAAYDYSVGEKKEGSAENDISAVDNTYQNKITSAKDKTPELTYTILGGGNGYPRLIWQYKYFQNADGGNSYGIISEYNNKYIQGTIEIESSIVTNYVTIKISDVEDWYGSASSTNSADHNNDTYTCTEPGKPVNAAEFLQEYFATEYAAYVTEWQAWDRDQSEDKSPTGPTLSKKAGELDEVQKRKYYCDNNTVKIGGSNAVSLKDYTLVQVIEETDPSKDYSDEDWEDQYVYVPQKINMNEGETNRLDSNGYLAKGFTTINGIGDRVFYGINNVTRLVTSDEFPLKYIGVSAFENSYIQSIDISNVTNISDRAFKGCHNLINIEMGPTNEVVGTEAFYDTRLSQIIFAKGIRKIGPGAFAECVSMQKADFSQIEGTVDIGKYAFYNTSALSSVIFTKSGTDTTDEEFERPSSDSNSMVSVETIGDGAFAVKPVSGALTNFTFPSKIARAISSTSYSGLGDCVLAGRSGLQRVTMPSFFGQERAATIPDNTFFYCFNLQCVKFPDNGDYSCGLATYNSEKLFASVNTDGFYVKGPRFASGNVPASPRKATWAAKTAVSDVVPYLYVVNGEKFYEVSNGKYLMCINDSGYLTSCTLMDGVIINESSEKETTLTIPSEVGTTSVVGIETGCFSDKEALNDKIKTLKISDNSISEINDGVFKEWKRLERVYIGNSVTKIGDEAFYNCKNLYDVTFSTPPDYSTFTIGRDAFVTNGTQLTFHGDIVVGYAPFDWAMAENNIINTDEVIDKNDKKAGVRVCYKSLAPTYLTVMYNPITELVTLLDYPKYDQISALLKEAHRQDIADAGCSTYEEWMVQKYYEQFETGYDDRRREFATAWINSSNPSELYSADFYGPWITPTFLRGWDDYIKTLESSGSTGGGENGGNLDNTLSVLADWLFEPIVASAADTIPKAYYDIYEYDIASNRDAGDPYRSPTPEETSLLYATEYINVPEGVGSIDAYGYYKNLTKDGSENPSAYNTLNVSTYLTNNKKDSNLDTLTQRMYFGPRVGSETENVIPGLFSGYYKDGWSGEADPRGNDRIKGVTLSSVAYLPNYAFDNCEQLMAVSIGAACSNIGIVPFRGCPILTNVNFNDNPKYMAANGIIYSRNTITGGMDTDTDNDNDADTDTNTGGYTGTYTIEECLYSRGRSGGVGAAVIPEAGFSDGLEVGHIGKVSEIRKGAFEDCGEITSVVLTGAVGLTKIPEDCFKNCQKIQTIYLPRTVNEVESGAFENDPQLTDIYVPGKEVQIAAKAFKEIEKNVTTIHTFADSAARRYAEMYADTYKLAYDELPEEWTVIFLDVDGNQIQDTLYKTNGSYLQSEEIPDPPEKEGWVFEKWLSTNKTDVTQPITADTIFMPQGYSSNGMIDGVHYVVEFYDQIDGSLLEPGGYQLVLPGEAAIPPQAPIHAGYTFVGWSSDEYLNVQKNLVILAMYSGSGTSGGSTNTPTSGNSSTTSRNSTSNGSSSTSTSATSTSSSATGKYTVTVVNGSGSGTYDAGSTVIIAANTPASGKVFSKWTTESQGVTLASVSMTATTFVMPANNVTVTANYVDGTSVNTLGGTVNNGNTGNRNPGNGSTTVSITKPGISNKDLATATVNGSTDNFVVKISETNEATQAVINALNNKYGNMDSILYYAMDISLYDSTGTVKITDTTGLTVDITIPIPDALTVFGGNNMAGAVVSNQLEDLSERFTTINGVPCISFTATHFSPYTIYVNTQNLSEGMLDVTPKTGDPIHPKWFLSLGLACISIILFMKKDKKPVKVKAA